jgi:hypothetical protein
LRAVRPGEGKHYVIRIDAFSDPAPPILDARLLPPDLSREIQRQLDRIDALSDQELMDQVYRRVIMVLCAACYRRWMATVEHGPDAPSATHS